MGRNMNPEIRKEKAARNAQILTTLGTLAVNPVTLLVGGFVLTNVLQHTVLTRGTTTSTKVTNPLAWWPWNSATYQAVDGQMTVITDDQANLLRLSMVMLASAQSGLLTSLGGLVAPIIKAVA